LKKRTKKLLHHCARQTGKAAAKTIRIFWFFFLKKNRFLPWYYLNFPRRRRAGMLAPMAAK
jgi:hypothetical protein